MAHSWRTDTVPNLALAAATGVLTAWLPPTRWSSGVRLGVHVATGASAAGVAFQVIGQSPSKHPEGQLPIAERLAIAATAGGVGIGASLVGLRLDETMEQSLVRRGVSRPRWWMGGAAAAISLGGWLLDRRTEQQLKATVGP